MAIIVAFGTNLPFRDSSPLRTCLKVINLTHKLRNSKIVHVSSIYKSAPWPSSQQPDYMNGIMVVECGENTSNISKTIQLMGSLHRIENLYGRMCSVPNAARTLDLDLIAAGTQICQTERLVLPHPRAHERAFVMVPIAEVMPDWVHPVLGRTAAEIAAELPQDGLTRLGRPEQLAAADGFRYHLRSPEL